MVAQPKLDRIDLMILAKIQEEGRIANVDLADAVGLSASPCLKRLRRLEKAGYIKRYEGVLNLDKIADSVVVFTEITISDHRRSDFVKFEAALAAEHTAIECHLISGGFDYLVKFQTRSITHYQEVIDRLLEADIGIAKYFSYIVIKSMIERRVSPLTLLANRKRR